LAIARHIKRHRDGWRWTELILQGLLIVILAALLVYAAILVIHGDLTQCEKQTAGSRTGVLLAGFALAGFVGGRILGYFRKLIHEAPPRVGATRTRPAGLVQGFLLLFLIGTTILLGYETYAVFQPNGNPPAITTYVRCAAAAGGWVAGLAATLIGLLLGSWLWYPTEEMPWQGFR
jgi:hypothetical protein